MAAKESTHLPHSRQPAILPFRPQVEALPTNRRAHGPAPFMSRADLGGERTQQHLARKRAPLGSTQELKTRQSNPPFDVGAPSRKLLQARRARLIEQLIERARTALERWHDEPPSLTPLGQRTKQELGVRGRASIPEGLDQPERRLTREGPELELEARTRLQDRNAPQDPAQAVPHGPPGTAPHDLEALQRTGEVPTGDLDQEGPQGRRSSGQVRPDLTPERWPRRARIQQQVPLRFREGLPWQIVNLRHSLEPKDIGHLTRIEQVRPCLEIEGAGGPAGLPGSTQNVVQWGVAPGAPRLLKRARSSRGAHSKEQERPPEGHRPAPHRSLHETGADSQEVRLHSTDALGPSSASASS